MSDDKKPWLKIHVSVLEIVIVLAIVLVVGDPDLLDAMIAKLGGITLTDLKEMRK